MTSSNPGQVEEDLPAIQKGETASIAVVEGDAVFGYPYFTIRRWTLSDGELYLIVDSGEVRISGAGLLKLQPLIQTQTLMVLRILPASLAADRGGEPVATAHSFREIEST